MTKLVIVESPTKARTIRAFLQDDYVVLDSRGHIRDLPQSASEIPAKVKKEPWANLGIDVHNEFQPLYVIAAGKRDIVRELKQALRTADELIIATDEDREGESIGWHIYDVLNPKVPVKRIVFHEITKTAILQALENPGQLNHDLINAQKARRILDRLVGYSLSRLLWKKVAPKLSAGRVQSVAVRLIVDREKARRAFVQGAFWDLVAQLTPVQAQDEASRFRARLHTLNDRRLATGKDLDKATGQLATDSDAWLLNEKQARATAAQLPHMAWTVLDVTERQTSRRPAAPFTTSSLQIEANRKFGFTAERTMRIAQGLYENGHITYMRTDSVHLSREAIAAARQRVKTMFGPEQMTPQPRVYKTRSKNAQEAHEAIRPAGETMATAAEKRLTGDDRRLYDLIWKRTLATQLADARLNNITVRIGAAWPDGSRPVAGDQATEAELAVTGAEFRARGTTILVRGFLALYVETAPSGEEGGQGQAFLSAPLPPLQDGEALHLHELEPEGHETKPPARYTEASLVKALVDRGIGRPSTYATIIATIQNRKYAFKHSQEIIPSFTAFAVVNMLEQSFASLVDFGFTARMEDTLDQIAAGETDWLGYVHSFYLGDMGLETQIEEQDTRIDPGLFRAVDLPDFAYHIRIGPYGPFVQKDLAANGQEPARLMASLPDDLAPADLTTDLADELFARKSQGPQALGLDEQSQHEIYLRSGRYGPYLQLGPDAQDGAKPKRISLPKGLPPEDVTLEMARQLLALPRSLGGHPEDGQEVITHIGRYGPYVSHAGKYANLSGTDTVFNVTLDRALALLTAKKEGRRASPKVLRELGVHPEDQTPIQLLDGRYGPYVKYNKINASLPKDMKPADLDLAGALELIAARIKNPPKRRRRRRS